MRGSGVRWVGDLVIDSMGYVSTPKNIRPIFNILYKMLLKNELFEHFCVLSIIFLVHSLASYVSARGNETKGSCMTEHPKNTCDTILESLCSAFSLRCLVMELALVLFSIHKRTRKMMKKGQKMFKKHIFQ